MTHTPKPWFYTRSDPAEGADIYWITAGTGNSETDIGIAATGKINSASEANAKLITAAPDLLAALKLAYGYVQKIEGQLRQTMGDNLITPDLRKIEGAIAKATGKT